MLEDFNKKPKKKPSSFTENIASKERRKLKALRSKGGVWFGLGMMGLIGWSVVIPTWLGVVLGAWIDTHYPGEHTWTLALLMAGLVIGCFNAWHWVGKEYSSIIEEQDND